MENQHPIDDILTHDFRIAQLGTARNILLNKREDDRIEVVLFGASVQTGERVLLTVAGPHDVDTAWRVEASTPDADALKQANHCVLRLEGTVTD